MTEIKNSKLLMGILAVIVCMAVMLAACRKPGEESTTPSVQAEKITYTIEIGTKSGMPLEKIGVYIYTDDTLSELVWFDKTDADGTMTFTDVASDSYVAVLSGVPDGYPVEETYPVTGEMTVIELGSELMEGVDLSEVTFELGSMMADFTFTDPDGVEYKISELLQEKNAVVLNFWYLECNPCRAEFPYLQKAYEAYSKQVEVLALNPVNEDDAAIADFKEDLELTFPMAKCDSEWQSAMQLTAYPTTVVIDRFGCIAMIHKGSITEEGEFEKILSFFSSEDYEQTIVESLEDLPEAEEPEDDDEETQSGGTEDDPLVYGGVTSFQITVKPGQLVYCQVYKLSNMYMSVSNKNAYVIYNDKTYNASYGTLGLMVTCPDMRTPCSLVFGNSGDETQTYTVNFGALKGTMANPYTLELGSFSTSVSAGNDQGVYYTYTAAEDGVLTVECTGGTAGVEYDYYLYNLNSYAMRNYRSDAETDSEGKKVVSIKVAKGQRVQFSAAAVPDSSGNYPAATFNFVASFSNGVVEETQPEEEKILYSVTVTDENRKPISGTQVYLTVDGNAVSLTTNENGVAHTNLVAGSYPVTVKVPTGYKARTTEFTLTQANPSVSVKLDPNVYVEGSYAVKVVDDANAPIQNVLVAVGDRYGYTDYNGDVSFALEKDSYSAYILVPDGYTAGATSFAFGSATSLNITLTRGESIIPETPEDAIPYSVTVFDNSGSPLANTLVRFVSGGANAAAVLTDASGIASTSLPAGTYTVSLAFRQSGSYYDTGLAVVTEAAPNLRIRVTNAKLDTSSSVKTYMGEMYLLSEGSTYVRDMQDNAPNFFIFAPDRSGTYRFSTSNASAVISFWGNNTAYIQDMTASTDYSAVTNAFTRNIKEGSLESKYIICVTGASSCIIDIVRIGDAVLDESDIVPEIYKAQTAPTKQSTPSGTKTYIDLSAATSACQIVKGSDGYYHLNSASGPILYVDLGTNAPYISFYNMLGYLGYGGTSFSRTFYDENGKAAYREDYTECMMSYVEAIDGTQGVYPLNDDLIYMIQNGGEHKGWWDSESPSFMFAGVANFNAEIAWMFACCYFA